MKFSPGPWRSLDYKFIEGELADEPFDGIYRVAGPDNPLPPGAI